MCLIGIIPPLSKMKHEIKDEYFINASKHNNDGCGFSFVENNKVYVSKGLWSIEKFLNLFKKARLKNKNSIFLTHQRSASVGKITVENCHPFKVNNISVVHNGTIFKFKDKDIFLSDSYKFIEVLRDLPKDWYENDIYYELIKKFIGFNNRVAFLFPSNEVSYIGDGWIEIENEIIFSNKYYIEEKPIENVYSKNIYTTKCNKCGSEDIHQSISGISYCENCYIEMFNTIKNKRFCSVCKALLTTSKELEYNLCSECLEGAMYGYGS